jgi:O-antigen/teichoic acid export membrane protein
LLKKKPNLPALNSTRANIVWALALQVVEKGAGYVILAVLTRTLLQEELGGMFFAISIARLAAVALSLGTDTQMIRKVASDPRNGLLYLSQNLSLRIVSMVVGYILLNAIFWAVRPELFLVMLLVSAYSFLDEIHFTFAAFFIGKKQILFRLAVMGSLKLIGIFVVSFAAYISRSLILVLWCQVFLSLILVISTFVITHRFFGRVQLKWEPTVKIELIKQSFPFLAVSLLGLMHMRFDTIMVGVLLDLQRVAVYELGIKLVEVARFLVRPIKTVFLPVFSEYNANGNWTKLRARFRQMMILAFAAGAGMFVLMLAFGSHLITLLFGEGYRESILITQVLFLSVPFLFAEFLANVVASALHLEKKIMSITAWTVALNIGLNLFVIPIYGILGAAWVTVASQVFLTTSLLVFVVSKLYGPPVTLQPVNSEVDVVTPEEVL